MSQPDNFTFTHPSPYAIYLPAVNTTYPKIIDDELPKSRPVPAGFTLDDLAFWSGKSKYWNHKYLLHSIGGYDVGSDPRGPLFRKHKGDFITIGDCGGYQIGKGTLKGLKDLKKGITGNTAVEAWSRNYDAKTWIINWLEQHCDYAMTIDMPLWAKTNFGMNSPFHNCSEEQLLSMTVENLRLIDREKQGRTKWLNVIQGTNQIDTLKWWNAVKWFKDGGWSLAGAAGWRGGLYNVLLTVLTMRDEGAFESGSDWIHMLGVSQPKWDIFLTAIQRQLRRSNPNIQISCDSASPFESGGARDQYALPPLLGKKLTDWSIGYKTLTAVRSDADRTKTTPSPLLSPLGQTLSLRDLVVDDSPMSGRRIDKFSNVFLMNHNTWIYLDAGRRANDAAFNSTSTDNIPIEFTAILEIIDTAFTTTDWISVLDTSKDFLDEIAPNMFNI
jgi:hypothetical protein